MHKNYFTFKAQTDWLQDILQNLTIVNCFTYQKSELILHLTGVEDYFLAISIDTRFPFTLLNKPKNIKQSKVELFRTLNRQKIKSISIHQFDKYIELVTEEYALHIIFYGRSPNIFLYDNNDSLIETFKKHSGLSDLKKEPGHQITPDEIDIEQLNSFLIRNKETDIVKILSRNISGFNYSLSREVCFRSQIDFATPPASIPDSQKTILIEKIHQIYSGLQNPKPQIYYDGDYAKYLSLIPLHHLQDDFESKMYKSLNDAWYVFTSNKTRFQQSQRLHDQLFQVLNKKIKYLESTLAKIEEFEQLEQRKKESEIKGNLILTFINQIPRGTQNVKLKNIFSQEQELINIKLNPSKNAQENAQKYFEKFKDINTQKKRIQNRKTTLMNELSSLQKITNQYKNTNTYKDIIKLQDILIQKKIIQSISKNAIVSDNLENQFRNIVLEEKWQVYIGKNDSNNDLLTFKFAHKFDWWFHAQGVPGSHTILRLNNKEEIPPKSIIENVASLAAFHSSAKHSSTVPVIYTEVRYVRKIKKAKPGTVSVLQHKTIFVEPKNL